MESSGAKQTPAQFLAFFDVCPPLICPNNILSYYKHYRALQYLESHISVASQSYT